MRTLFPAILFIFWSTNLPADTDIKIAISERIELIRDAYARGDIEKIAENFYNIDWVINDILGNLPAPLLEEKRRQIFESSFSYYRGTVSQSFSKLYYGSRDISKYSFRKLITPIVLIQNMFQTRADVEVIDPIKIIDESGKIKIFLKTDFSTCEVRPNNIYPIVSTSSLEKFRIQYYASLIYNVIIFTKDLKILTVYPIFDGVTKKTVGQDVLMEISRPAPIFGYQLGLKFSVRSRTYVDDFKLEWLECTDPNNIIYRSNKELEVRFKAIYGKDTAIVEIYVRAGSQFPDNLRGNYFLVGWSCEAQYIFKKKRWSVSFVIPLSNEFIILNDRVIQIDNKERFKLDSSVLSYFSVSAP